MAFAEYRAVISIFSCVGGLLGHFTSRTWRRVEDYPLISPAELVFGGEDIQGRFYFILHFKADIAMNLKSTPHQLGSIWRRLVLGLIQLLPICMVSKSGHDFVCNFFESIDVTRGICHCELLS
jgi:hypothetical protein